MEVFTMPEPTHEELTQKLGSLLREKLAIEGEVRQLEARVSELQTKVDQAKAAQQ